MIIEYHRPQTVDKALSLISRMEPQTVPLGGGTALNRPSKDPIAVVDLQELGLDTYEKRGNILDLGATVNLQALLDNPEISPALRRAIRHEATYNLRQAATVAGRLVACDGRSPFATAFLALDAQLTTQPDEEQINLGDLLSMRIELLKGRLITKVAIPLNARLVYEYVARTPADLPIVCVTVAQWPSGRVRVALGGYGDAPSLAMDGPTAEGAEIAAQNAYSHASDEWASGEYRKDVAGILTRRCLAELSE